MAPTRILPSRGFFFRHCYPDIAENRRVRCELSRSGCLIRTNFSPILIYVCRMGPGPRLKRTFALLKATLTRVQALFSIRGTRGIAAFSTRARFWRDTGEPKSALLGIVRLRTGVHRVHRNIDRWIQHHSCAQPSTGTIFRLRRFMPSAPLKKS